MKSLLPILGRLLTLESLSGVRTYLAAFGLVGLAVSQFLGANYDGAVQSALAALGLLGLRAKLEDPAVVVIARDDLPKRGD